MDEYQQQLTPMQKKPIAMGIGLGMAIGSAIAVAISNLVIGLFLGLLCGGICSLYLHRIAQLHNKAHRQDSSTTKHSDK